ncbi:L-rhamnose mutarotase [Paenibacillus hemerocallicola]|uniref:L-rhamnose mutarotase n=1 Tax=Paenibacillus hemerocallicola TaxID=1172614 RepID=A0A5C4T586_9BACL|nr:L-rhamnose mutarotase [Paenibacillus hemerocallicola]TNJ63507.1 L-rhamnose mutarotase [Paenibacillus hemerocallicola]
MEKRAFTINIKAGAEAEYKRRHEAVWPRVREALRRHGVRSYSIFMQGTTLFAYMEMEGDFEESFRQLHQDPASVEWRDYMSDLIIRDENMGFHFLECVFRLDGFEPHREGASVRHEASR